MPHWIPFLLLPALALTGCDSSDPAPTAAPAAAPEAAPATPAQVDPAELDGEARKVTLVPSPVETQKELQDLGIDTDLATFMKSRTIDAAGSDEDSISLATGVVVADMLLTVTASDDATLLNQLAQVRNGMAALKGGSDILATIDDLTERVKAGAMNRDNLLKELDELSGVMIPELEFEGQARVVPLIQAGSWLEGVHLIAKAAKGAGNLGACDQMLKQPMIVEYFKEYTAQKGEEGGANMVFTHLSASLARLEQIADKKEPLTAADVDEIISVTGGLLGLI
jgi:hypothetical protein